MKLGGLFSGVGGFELAWTRLGGEVAWMCEIDKSAQKVLRARFPNVPIYDDVRQIDPAELEAVDVLTGGSPCQGFSVAGSRSGLEHGESRLFADYIRIMDGLAERGLQFGLWENVPGVLSIQNDDGEMTFENVVAALVGAKQPIRLDRNVRWNTGMATRSGRAVSWRVLDSRYFGVAQRRRRIFACVAFGDSCEDRAGRTLLAVSEGVRRDFASRYETGQGAAGSVAESVGVPCVAGTLAASGAGTSRTSGNGNFLDFVIPQVLAETEVMRKVRSDDFVGDDTSSTLAARDHKDYGDLVVEPAVLLTMREGKPGGGKGPLISEQESLTLATGNGQVLVDSYGVRRLTPVECERLQAFPDGWTEPAGSDSARYKAMGNAVTVNVVTWILGRICQNMSKVAK